LKRGDAQQLVDHWSWFFDREGAEYTIERKDDTIRMTVRRCPAVAYLRSRGIRIDPAFCRQTAVMNAAWSEGTPFRIATKILGNGRCVQTIRRVRGRSRGTIAR
jgi:hypothetical protein